MHCRQARSVLKEKHVTTLYVIHGGPLRPSTPAAGPEGQNVLGDTRTYTVWATNFWHSNRTRAEAGFRGQIDYLGCGGTIDSEKHAKHGLVVL